jgi:transcriptional regulator with XRE-family HTH domain
MRLRAIREERGLTQEAAAELAGIHAKHLSVIEIGKTNIGYGSLVALAYAYQVSIEAFFKGTPVPR